MRSLVCLLTMLATGLAAAQEPIAPAVEQADDSEAPPMVRALPPPAPPLPSTAPALGKGVLLMPPPSGWRYRVTDAPPTRDKQWGLFTAGLVTLSVSWVATLQAGIPTAEWRLDVPLLGPLLELQRISGDSGFEGFFDLLLVTDAVMQIGGFAMMVAGASTHKQRPGAQRLELVPMGAGAAIRGSF